MQKLPSQLLFSTTCVLVCVDHVRAQPLMLLCWWPASGGGTSAAGAPEAVAFMDDIGEKMAPQRIKDLQALKLTASNKSPLASLALVSSLYIISVYHLVSPPILEGCKINDFVDQ
jgi:hypothetical protein